MILDPPLQRDYDQHRQGKIKHERIRQLAEDAFKVRKPRGEQSIGQHYPVAVLLQGQIECFANSQHCSFY